MDRAVVAAAVLRRNDRRLNGWLMGRPFLQGLGRNLWDVVQWEWVGRLRRNRDRLMYHNPTRFRIVSPNGCDRDFSEVNLNRRWPMDIDRNSLYM